MEEDLRLTCFKTQFTMLHREILKYKLIAQSRALSFREFYYLQMLEEDLVITKNLILGDNREKPKLFALESQRPIQHSRADLKPSAPHHEK